MTKSQLNNASFSEGAISGKRGVLHLIDSGGFYGAEAVVLNLCLGLRDSGFKSIIGCFWNSEDPKPELGLIAESKGLCVEYIRTRRARVDFGVIKTISQIMNEKGLSMMHSHGYKPSFYCLLVYFLYRIPYIITCHLWPKGLTSRYILLERISMLFAKKIAAVSCPIAEDIGAWRPLKRSTAVINNGIDIEQYANYEKSYESGRLRKELGLRQDTRLIGTLGRLTPQKAHDCFIEAARIMLDNTDGLEFLIAGEGELRGYLEHLISEKGISDKFHLVGFRSDAIHMMKLLDVFVLCSIEEGLPIVLLEAMSVGVPIVTTAVGEIPKVIQDGSNGLIAKVGDCSSLAQSVLKLLHNGELCRGLTENAKEMVNTTYSMSAMSKEYLAIYSTISA